MKPSSAISGMRRKGVFIQVPVNLGEFRQNEVKHQMQLMLDKKCCLN